MNRIAELRKEKKLNQIGLAMKLNVSQRMVSAYENELSQPSIDMLIQMSKIFGVSVDYIIGNTEVRIPAERFLINGITEDEIKLLDLYRNLTEKDRQRAIGIVFALKNI